MAFDDSKLSASIDEAFKGCPTPRECFVAAKERAVREYSVEYSRYCDEIKDDELRANVRLALWSECQDKIQDAALAYGVFDV